MSVPGLDNFMRAMGMLESGGNYNARNSRTGASGKYQIMPSNWSPWAREAGLSANAPRTPQNQERVARHKLGQYFNQFGSWEAVAVAWFAGPGRAQRYVRNPNDQSLLRISDGNLTIRQYVERVMARMGQGGQQPQQRSAGFPTELPPRPEGQEQQPISFDQLAGVEADPRDMLTAIFDSMSNQIAGGQREPFPWDEGTDQLGAIPTQQADAFADVDGATTSAWDRYGGQGRGQAMDWLDDAQMILGRFGRDALLDAMSEVGDLGVPPGTPPPPLPPREEQGQPIMTDSARQRAAGGGSWGEQIIQTGRQYLGVPYLWGGTNPNRGLDCSGFTQLVFKELGVNLPRVSRDQARTGRRVASLADARPGDLIAFNSPVSHIGIYMGNGRMIHAPRRGKNVEITNVGNRNITAIRRHSQPRR